MLHLDSCLAPHCLQRFRSHARTHCTTLDALCTLDMARNTQVAKREEAIDWQTAQLLQNATQPDLVASAHASAPDMDLPLAPCSSTSLSHKRPLHEPAEKPLELGFSKRKEPEGLLVERVDDAGEQADDCTADPGRQGRATRVP